MQGAGGYQKVVREVHYALLRLALAVGTDRRPWNSSQILRVELLVE
jgi:hypothetical protein